MGRLKEKMPTDDLQKRAPINGYAPFALGFRPFFLAAGVYAVLMMWLWLGVLQGGLRRVTCLPLCGTDMKCCLVSPWR